MGRYTRRDLLAGAAGVTTLAATAGCLAGLTGSEQSAGADVEASFFVFGDFAEAVVGDAAAAETLVPIGQHGHGWEPGPRVREDVYQAMLFVHGMEGFQPWADDMLEDMVEDDADAEPVDITEEIRLLEAGSAHDHQEDHTDEHQDDHQEDQDGQGHDPDGADPHFWMDPLRAKAAVHTLRNALTAVDPDNAAAYEANAAAYEAELEDLHERIESIRGDASTDVLLIAGHDSFQYFGARYDVTIQALTDVSPDDQPTTRDLQQAQQSIEEHGLEYVCADPLESQQAAEQLVAETDATEVLPLTAMPGRKDEWADEGWGYVEIMEQVNLPTIERALGA